MAASNPDLISRLHRQGKLSLIRRASSSLETANYLGATLAETATSCSQIDPRKVSTPCPHA